MRFLFLTQYFAPEVGAPQVRLAAMARELVRLGHEVEVVTAMPNYPEGVIWRTYRRRLYRRDDWEGVTVHRVWLFAATGAGLKRLLNYLSFSLASLFGLMRARRPDFIFAESPPLTIALPATVFAAWWRKPLILNVADLWPDSMRELGLMRPGLALSVAEWLEAWAYRRATFINAVTEGIRKTLIELKHVAPAKVLFLPNGVDTQLFLPQAPDLALAASLELTRKKVVVFAGTLGLFQGLDVAIEAFARLRHTDPDAVLLFLGGGSDRTRLESKAQELGLANVRFLGAQPIEYVARIYSIATAGFASLKNLSLFEGARPSKVFPIMSSGKPVVFSGAGEGARLIKEAGAGIVTAPEDANELTEAFRRLLRDPALAASMGASGRRYVEERLSWARLVKAWLEQFIDPSSSMQPPVRLRPAHIVARVSQ
jgi:putative colanic acid biosynthesis glycosyltransferase WcaI